ncbi:hypothetical protein J3F84DRAFT_384807 [Trichoderma pleuroticola]
MLLAAPTTGQTPIKLSDPPKAQGSGRHSSQQTQKRLQAQRTRKPNYYKFERRRRMGFEGRPRNWTEYGACEREAEKKKLCRWEA